jgi:predicted AlkP superfamily pyrophosphatase or phosphodiesterase
MRLSRSVFLLPLLLLTAVPACAQGRATPPAATAEPAPAPQGPRPRLVVLITVDQLRPDYLTHWHGQLTGGFRMLVEEGRFFSEAVHDHAVTETAPGHASTLSGRFPYSTGIASNSAGVNTSAAPLIDSDGTGASPFRFKGTTLGDWMAARDPQTRILSVSRKDRGAILPIGAARRDVYWYAQRSGKFTTSTYYRDTLPSWVQAFNAEDHAGTRYAGQAWTLLLPESAYPEPDSVPEESGGQGFVFPHLLPADPELARNQILSHPWMDQMTLDFAWRGIQEMGLGGSAGRTDLLAVSLSTMDAVGHRWGPDSRELHDQVLRVDRMLGVFFDSLFARVGRENVVVALTSDHGVAPVIGVRSRWGDNSRAGRLNARSFERAIQSVAPMVQRAGIPGDAIQLDWGVLEVDRSKTQGKEREVLAIARAFAREARRVPGVMRVDVIDDLARADTVRDAYARRWLHMFRPGGEALAGLTLEPFWYYGNSIATHGSPHDYDAKVPVIFWGAAFAAGNDTGTARVVDIAPTLSHLLGITPSERLDGVVLGRAFKR